MDILTKEKIQGYLKREDKRVSTDGWADDASFGVVHERIHGLDMYSRDYKLTFEVNIQGQGRPTGWEDKQAATAIHKELYGGIIDDLILVRHIINNGTREKAFQAINKLLKKFTNDT